MLDRELIRRDPQRIRLMLERRGMKLDWHRHRALTPQGWRTYEGLASRCFLCKERETPR